MAENSTFKGFFTHAGNIELQAETKSSTYKLTPKYNDPYAPDADRKIAKFVILNKAFRTQLSKLQGAASDPLLKSLIEDRGYFDFFLQSVEETFDEKFQIMETLGDGYAVFGLGKKPRLINCTGAVLNSQENDWRINFIKLFEKYISISRLAKFRNGDAKNVVSLVYDSVTVSGAILNLRTSLRAENELYSAFAFTMLVTNSTNFNIEELSSVKIQATKTTPAASTLSNDGTTTPEETTPGTPGNPDNTTISVSEHRDSHARSMAKVSS